MYFKSIDDFALELHLPRLPPPYGEGGGEQKEIVNCIIKNTTIDSYSFIVENNVFLLGYKS